MNLGLFKAMLVDFCGDRITIADARLLSIINMARDRIQRGNDLAFAKKITSATYPATTSAGYTLPTDFKSFVSGKAVWFTGTDGYQIFLPATTRTILENQGMPATDSNKPREFYVELTTTGSKMFVTFESGFLSQAFSYRYNCFLAAYTADGDEDFLLQRGYDALLWESLKVLNLYLKNEERIQIDEPASARAIDELNRYCIELERGGAAIGGY